MEIVLVAGAAGAAGAYIMRKVQKRRYRKSHQRWLTSNYNAPQLLDMQHSEGNFHGGPSDPWERIEYQATRRIEGRGVGGTPGGVIIEELPPKPEELLLLEDQRIPDTLFKERTEYRFNTREELDAFLRERGLESGPTVRSRREVVAFSSNAPSSTSNLRNARRLEAYASYREEYEGPGTRGKREAYKYSQQDEFDRLQNSAPRQPRGSSSYEQYPERHGDSPYSSYPERIRDYPPSHYSDMGRGDRYDAPPRPSYGSRDYAYREREIEDRRRRELELERERERDRERDYERRREKERQRRIEDAFYGRHQERVPDTEQLFVDRDEEARYRRMESEREIDRMREGEREYLRALEEARWRRQPPALPSSSYAGEEYPSGPDVPEPYAQPAVAQPQEGGYVSQVPALEWEEPVPDTYQTTGEEEEEEEEGEGEKTVGRVAQLRAQLEKSGGIRLGGSAERQMSMATAGTRAFASGPPPIPPSYVPSPTQSPGLGTGGGVGSPTRPGASMNKGKWTPPPPRYGDYRSEERSGRGAITSGIGSKEAYSPSRDAGTERYPIVEDGTDGAGYGDYQDYEGTQEYGGYDQSYDQGYDQGYDQQYETYENYPPSSGGHGEGEYGNYEGYEDYGNYDDYPQETVRTGYRSPVPVSNPPPIPPRFK